MSNLNKILAFLILVGFGLSCAYAVEVSTFSKGFKKAFKDCDRYEETINSEFEGRKFTTKRNIQGWRNGFCNYQEVVSTGNEVYQINCGFTNVQVDELSEAMNSRSKEIIRHDLDIFAEQKDPKTGNSKYVIRGTTLIKGNKAFIAWAKYQNNPYFCSRKKL